MIRSSLCLLPCLLACLLAGSILTDSYQQTSHSNSRAAAMPHDNRHNMGRCVQAAAVNTDTLIIVVLVHGGPLDVSWLEKSDRISGILSAWYPGQVITSGSLSGNPLSVTALCVTHETVWRPPLCYSIMCFTCKTVCCETERQKRAQGFLPSVQILFISHTKLATVAVCSSAIILVFALFML